MFSEEDFTQENTTRLSVIIMKEMGKPPIFQFRDLSILLKTKFNRLMNKYINTLGEDWETKLLNDFNDIVNEDILNEDFDAGRIMVLETITERNVLLNDEQKEWIKNEEEKGIIVKY